MAGKYPGTLSCGIDVGTQGTKSILYDLATHAIVGRGSFAYDLLSRTSPNAAEQDPQVWLDGIKASVADALKQASATAEDIASVSVSGQQHGMVCLDASGAVVRPAKLWCDTESAPEAEELSKVFGWAMQAGFTASKALWLKRHEPENWARTTTILLPHDYVNWYLTGVKAMEAGDASGVGVMDPASRTFKDKWCRAVDPRFASMLPSALTPPDATVGTVTPTAAAELGLPTGIPVATGSGQGRGDPGCGDNMMSALGAGCVSEGRLVVSLGTSGTLFGYSASPVVDRTGAVAPFCDATGGYLPLLCTMNCTQVVSEVSGAFGGGRSHEELAAEAEQFPPGCEGVRFLPYLVGERSPNWPHASGALTGLRPGSLGKPGLLYRAALEGATYSLLAGVRRMNELGLPPPTELAVVGGGSKSALCLQRDETKKRTDATSRRQTIADAFNVPVRRPLEAESAALGAALQAAALVSGTSTKDYVLAHPPAYADEVEHPDAEAATVHAANYAKFVWEGQSLFA